MMYKNINKNLTIDLIAKTLVPSNNPSQINKLETIKNFNIVTTLDYKTTPLKYIKQYIKRDYYKLMKLIGQRPTFIQSKKSVAEWKLRKDTILGSQITLRGQRNIERVYKLWLFSSQTRDNQRQTINKYGQRGVQSEGIEWWILVNDWPMSDLISSNKNWKTNETKDKNFEIINDELRELKLRELGMHIDIKLSESNSPKDQRASEYDSNQEIFKLSYYLFLIKKIL